MMSAERGQRKTGKEEKHAKKNTEMLIHSPKKTGKSTHTIRRSAKRSAFQLV